MGIKYILTYLKNKFNFYSTCTTEYEIYVYINMTYFCGSDIVRQSMVYVCSIKQLHSLEIHSQNLKDPTHCTDLPMKLLTTSTHFEVKMELLSSPSFTAIALIKHSPCFLRTTPFSGLYSYRNRNKNR